mgnify:CR=1 FL=1
MKKRLFAQWLVLAALSPFWLQALPAQAADEAPNALIERLTKDALDTIQADNAIQAGDVARISDLVDQKIMPHLDFQRMTAAAVGPAWRQATPEQRKRLQTEFKLLLVRTYAGALSQAKNLTFRVLPLRAAADDKEVVVRTQIIGRGEPAQLDYRLEKTPGEGAGWKIFNLNVLGVWLVDTYRSQFAQEVNAKGIDGLIGALADRNKASGNAKAGKS